MSDARQQHAANGIASWDPAAAEVYGCRRCGANHIRRGTPCQDAWGQARLVDGRRGLALAVADGHGASLHDLSEVGARLAVDAGTEAIRQCVSETGDGSVRDLAAAFRQKLPRLVMANWHEAIRRDMQERAPDADLTGKRWHAAVHRYGSTLLMALVIDETVLISSIGDGDVLLLDTGGNVKLHLEQDLPELGRGVTLSLASTDAPFFFQTAFATREPDDMLLMCTDGLTNSFINQNYCLEFFNHLRSRVAQFGFSTITPNIPAWLDYLSTHGSGDDITLAMAWLGPAPRAVSDDAATMIRVLPGRRIVRTFGIKRQMIPHRVYHAGPWHSLHRHRTTGCDRQYSSALDYSAASIPGGRR